MKGKLIIIIGMGILCNLFGCTLGINDVDPHTSKTIETSKKDGFFIAEYSIEQNPEGMFSIKEVWQEKTWFYKIKNLFNSEKEIRTNTSKILLSLDLERNNTYTYETFSTKWGLLIEGTDKYVGYYGGNLGIRLPDTLSPEVVRLQLIKNPHQDKNKTSEILGTITLTRKH